MAQAVSLFHRKKGYHVLVFSDMRWGGCVTQVLTTEFVEGVRLTVSNSAWTNGTVERTMRETLKASKAILNERGQPLSAWITVPLVQ